MFYLFVVGLGHYEESLTDTLQEERLKALSCLIFRSVPNGMRSQVESSYYEVIELEDYFQEDLRLGLGNFKQKAAAKLEEVLEKEGSAAYVVPGTMAGGDALVRYLEQHMRGKGKELCCEFLGEGEYWDKIIDFMGRDELSADFSRGLNILDVYDLDNLREPFAGELLLFSRGSGKLLELADRYLASYYPRDQRIDLLEQGGGEAPISLQKSSSLAQAGEIKHKGWNLFLRVPRPKFYLLGDMVSFMSQLRSPEGCPWDRQQDHYSLRRYLLEEAYEVLAAVNGGDPAELCEELGDLLLQVIFHSQLAAEKGDFFIWQVIDGITEKIYRRHPHVFQDGNLNTPEEVSLKWQEIKRGEKGKDQADVFEVPQDFPALLRAQKIQKRASELGFDWVDIREAAEKITEELQEILKAYNSGEEGKLEEEVGDLLFSLVNVARFLGIESEVALTGSIEKFKHRFRYIARQVEKSGKEYSSFTLQELDYWWEEAKGLEKDENKSKGGE